MIQDKYNHQYNVNVSRFSGNIYRTETYIVQNCT